MNPVVLQLNPEGAFDLRTMVNRPVADGVQLRFGTLTAGGGAGQALLFDRAAFDEGKAQSWYERYRGQFLEDGAIEPVETVEAVEIFAAGEYHGKKFTEKEVEAIAERTARGSQSGRPPWARIGHTDKTETYGERLRVPRLGTLKNIRYQAGKVIADVIGAPRRFAQAVKNGAYPERSVEIIYRDPEGNPIEPVIESVGFIGQGHGAVKTLAGLGVLYASEGMYQAPEEGDRREPIAMRIAFGEKEASPMPEPEKKVGVVEISETELNELRAAKEELDKIRPQVEQLASLKGEMETLAKEKENQAKRISDLEAATRNQTNERLVDDLIREGKLEPAVRMAEIEHLNRLDTLPAEAVLRFSEGGQEKTVTLKEHRVRELQARKPVPEMGAPRADARQSDESDVPLTESARRKQREREQAEKK
jgi:hypothetical protein